MEGVEAARYYCWYCCQGLPPSPGSSQLGSRTHGHSAQAASATDGATVLNTEPACAGPRSVQMKLLGGGGSVKVSPWLGCKHPAGSFFLWPRNCGCWTEASIKQKLPGPSSFILHSSVSHWHRQLCNPTPGQWASGHRLLSLESAPLS